MAPTYEAAFVGAHGRWPYGDKPVSAALLGHWLPGALKHIPEPFSHIEVREHPTGQLVRIKPRGK